MNTARSSAIVSAGILLGAGLGGFVDGILLHQILQWHDMLSTVRPPTDLVTLKYNMVWDGIFHAFTWAMTCVGLGRLWAAGKREDVPWSTATFVGSLVMGWGLFNFVEGLIDHQLLGPRAERLHLVEERHDRARLPEAPVAAARPNGLRERGVVVAAHDQDRDRARPIARSLRTTPKAW